MYTHIFLNRHIIFALIFPFCYLLSTWFSSLFVETTPVGAPHPFWRAQARPLSSPFASYSTPRRCRSTHHPTGAPFRTLRTSLRKLRTPASPRPPPPPSAQEQQPEQQPGQQEQEGPSLLRVARLPPRYQASPAGQQQEPRHPLLPLPPLLPPPQQQQQLLLVLAQEHPS